MEQLDPRTLQGPPPLTYNQANVINEFRILMSRLAYLTRFYIVERITGIGSPQTTFNEIVQIAIKGNELAQSVAGYTGDAPLVTSNYLANILSLIDGMVSGNQELADESIRQLYEISNEYAKYLAGLSPYWDEATWQNLLFLYNQALVAEILAIEMGDFNQALDIFEGLMEKSLLRGDYYAQGLIHLLPEDEPQIPIGYFNLIQDFRRTGTEWAYLTRFYTAAKLVGFGDEEYVIQRFNVLISQLKEKFELIFGSDLAEQLLQLLSTYTTLLESATEIILTDDPGNIRVQEEALDQIVSSLAIFLSSINPYWDELKWEELFSTFVELTIQHGSEFQNKDYVAAMETFDELLYAALAISDYFAVGVYLYTLMDGTTGQST